MAKDKMIYYAVIKDNAAKALAALERLGGNNAFPFEPEYLHNDDVLFVNFNDDHNIHIYDSESKDDWNEYRWLMKNQDVISVQLTDETIDHVTDDVRNVYIVQDGTHNGADIIVELERRGAKNELHLNGRAKIQTPDEDNIEFVYYADDAYIIHTAEREDFDTAGRVEISLNEPAQTADPQKVYIVQDGTLNGADVIKELERRGGINTNEFEGEIGECEKPAIYFIYDKNVIDSTWASKEAELIQRGYTRVYLHTDAEPADNGQQQEQTPSTFAMWNDNGDELTINLAAIVPAGCECLDNEGRPISKATYKVTRKHFRPTEGQEWFSVSDDDFVHYPISLKWRGDDTDLFMYNNGNCFETREQAQRLADVMNETYKRTIKQIHGDK